MSGSAASKSGGAPFGAGLSAGFAQVQTSETTSSTTPTDLATVGPSVTLNLLGTTALVTLSANMYRGGAGNDGYIGVAVSGASSISATTISAAGGSANTACFVANFDAPTTRTFLITGLTPGVNTFTAKYWCNGGGPWTFQSRCITVIDPASGAQNSLLTSQYAKLASDITSMGTDPTYTDIVSTTCFTGTTAEIKATVCGLAASGNGTPRLRVLVDNVEIAGLGGYGAPYTSGSGVSQVLDVVADNLSPGTHTFKLQGSWSGLATWGIHASTNPMREFAVLIIKP
jgi:hypothetical protein